MEASERLAEYGPNRLSSARPRSALLRFLTQFHNLLIYVLLGSATVTALLGHWVDTAVILAVVILNALIGFIQEGRAERALDAIRGMLTSHASVMRDGRRLTVGAEDLVPGDRRCWWRGGACPMWRSPRCSTPCSRKSTSWPWGAGQAP